MLSLPGSMGGTLDDIALFLQKPEMKEVFSSCYILPSLFHTDLDRGFSVIDYSLNKMLASREALEKLESLGIDLKLDFIFKSCVRFCQNSFRILLKTEKTQSIVIFIDWNKFWDGCGKMTEEGYIQPEQKYIKDMFFRKPGLPILMVRFPWAEMYPIGTRFIRK